MSNAPRAPQMLAQDPDLALSPSTSEDEHKVAPDAEKAGNSPQGQGVEADEAGHIGVTRIEALYLVFGKGWKVWLLYASIGLICYSSSLASNTTYTCGIGFHLCEAFLARNCRVFAASRNLTKMEGLPAAVTKIELDVNDEESIAKGVKEIVERVGRIDVLVNNAGQGCVAPMIEVDMMALRQTFDVNVFGLVAMVQVVAPHMIRQRSGTIVNIGSIVAYVPTPWAGVYCASKAAVHSFSDTMRMELAGAPVLSPFLTPQLTPPPTPGFGINVMCVAPGAIKSGIGAANDSKTFLKPDSFYTNVESFVRSRGSWSQTPQSTPTAVLAETIVGKALAARPPRYLSTGYRSTSAVLSYYLPTFVKERLWGSQFGIDEVGKL